MLLPFAFNLDQYIFGPLLFLLSLFIILIVLLQRGRGGGLAGALGGAGGSSALGVKAGDIFTRITAVSVILWIFLCAFVCWYYLEPLPDISASPTSSTPSLSIGPRDGSTGGAALDEANSEIVSPAQTVLPTLSQPAPTEPATTEGVAPQATDPNIDPSASQTKPAANEGGEVKQGAESAEIETESNEAAKTTETAKTDAPPVSTGDGSASGRSAGDGN